VIKQYSSVDFERVVDFSEDTHRVKFDRPLMFPDVIGGHCLIPNTELLLKNYDSKFLRLVLESNRRWEEGVKDEDVRREVDTDSCESSLISFCRLFHLEIASH